MCMYVYLYITVMYTHNNSVYVYIYIYIYNGIGDFVSEAAAGCSKPGDEQPFKGLLIRGITYMRKEYLYS